MLLRSITLFSRTIFPSSTVTATAPKHITFYRMSSSTSPSSTQHIHEQSVKESHSQNNSNNENQDGNKTVLALPAPGKADNGANQLEVNGQDLKLDILGPVVVNEDGTMSRIDNWHEMAEIEKANVRRILLKRNAQRLERLRAEQNKEGESVQ